MYLGPYLEKQPQQRRKSLSSKRRKGEKENNAKNPMYTIIQIPPLG